MTDKTYGDLELMARIMRRARPYWPHIVAIFLLGLLATPLALLAPLPLTITVDSVIGSDPLPDWLSNWIPGLANASKEALLIFAVMMVLLVTLLSQLQRLASDLLQAYTGEKLTLEFRNDLFRHLQRLSLSYHDVQGTADSTYRIQYDTVAIRYLVIDGITPFISAIVTLVAMLIVIFRLDWQLALVAVIISPILFFIARFYRGQLRQQSRQVKRIESSALSVTQEVLTSLRVVMAFGQENREQRRFEHQSALGVKARIRYVLSEGTVGLLLGMTVALGTALVLYLGINHVLLGLLTLGELLLIMGYLGQFYDPLKTISRKVTSLQNHLASAERAYSLQDLPPAIQDAEEGQALKRAKGEVAFQEVSFSYDGEQDVLQDISFSVGAGQRVGIAGETGAGKSTIMGLLVRFYDPAEGRILLDGIDLRDYKVADLRDQFAIVLQDTVLFSTSIAENIAYARPEASQEEIIRAAKAAKAHYFISQLPDGYDTEVGEKGMLLSGGERQRIALARAFLKDAPILILDEPTSSVDMKTEGSIMKAMERLMQGRTTFLVAHRLSTLVGCDILLTIEDGQLASVREGTSQVRAALEKNGQLPDIARPNVGQHQGEPPDILWRESAAELESFLHQTGDVHQRKRLEALVLLKGGESLIDTSQAVGVSYRTLLRWLAWYRHGGLEEVMRRTPGAVASGRQPWTRTKNGRNGASGKRIQAGKVEKGNGSV